MDGWAVSLCSHCDNVAVWHDDALVSPNNSVAPLPSPDLPAEIATDFEEARAILQQSPRGAAALFRLCIQKLCAHLGEPGVNLNADIAALVKKGLNVKIQKSLDIVRVIGNESVHPGTLDLRDAVDTANQLALLINIIVDSMITQPKHIDALYEQIPKDKRQQIEKRDGISKI